MKESAPRDGIERLVFIVRYHMRTDKCCFKSHPLTKYKSLTTMKHYMTMNNKSLSKITSSKSYSTWLIGANRIVKFTLLVAVPASPFFNDLHMVQVCMEWMAYRIG